MNDLKWKKKKIEIDWNENDMLVKFNLYDLMKPKLQRKISRLLEKVPSKVIDVEG